LDIPFFPACPFPFHHHHQLNPRLSPLNHPRGLPFSLLLHLPPTGSKQDDDHLPFIGRVPLLFNHALFDQSPTYLLAGYVYWWYDCMTASYYRF
jgi:hypothetical protein